MFDLKYKLNSTQINYPKSPHNQDPHVLCGEQRGLISCLLSNKIPIIF